ncbi:DedA family protein [Nocardioides marmoriginsengisoli]|uniref:DedA family protein n=2 Tax=Nocardioides marmoriginsengisoli TaxID=661483 RepID=A0A3N0CBL6_9ACTN|nr:DedA family protein [Nocardioides marmoriginsengisoli]
MDPNWWLAEFGQEFFWISVAMIFVECGLLFPFLPGDTLLFAMGLFFATDRIDVLVDNNGLSLLFGMLIFGAAAVLGNVAGYEIGRAIGPPLTQRDGRILKKKYFDKTTEFFDKHGNKALVIGRFVPFVRTYVTVVAGVASMERRRFLTWSAVGAAFWVLSITMLGYFLGNVPKVGPFLSDNIDFAILAILLFSVIPVAYEWLKHRREAAARTAAPTASGSDVEI